MSTVISTKLFLVATVVALVVISSTVYGSLSPTPSTLSSSSSNPNSDLISEYILRDLIRSSTNNQNVNNNNHKQYFKFTSGRPFAQRLSKQRNNRFMDTDIKDHDDGGRDNDEQMIRDFYASLLYGSPRSNSDGAMPSSSSLDDDYYYQSVSPSISPMDDEPQQLDLGWFDGPVLPKVSPIKSSNDYDNSGDGQQQEETSLLLNPMMLVPNDDETVLDSETFLNALWAKYLASNLYQQQSNNEEPIGLDDIDIEPRDSDYNEDQRVNSPFGGGWMDKRRQKIVKHDDGTTNMIKMETTTIASNIDKTSSSSMMESISNEKAKFLHKAAEFNKNYQLGKQHQTSSNGQKEYPLLRPASENNNNKKNQDQEWPSELDENTLVEENSLKQLPKMSKQQRSVRDVLTSQLDSLKMEKKRNSNNNQEALKQ